MVTESATPSLLFPSTEGLKERQQDDGKEMVDKIRHRISAPTPAPGPTSSAIGVDPIEQLRKLGELRDAGVVTPEEFETKKAELLSRL